VGARSLLDLGWICTVNQLGPGDPPLQPLVHVRQITKLVQAAKLAPKRGLNVLLFFFVRFLSRGIPTYFSWSSMGWAWKYDLDWAPPTFE
jgi:hypothetical protein